VRLRVATAIGVVSVDTEDGEVAFLEDGVPPAGPSDAGLRLPLHVASARCGSRIVAVVRRRPPLVISDDAGSTWREVGGGLPRGVDVAIAPGSPDTVAFASESRVYLSIDGGVFWQVIDTELPQIASIAWEPD
jgi:hypothetical protein